MSKKDRVPQADGESEDEDLSELEQRNLDSILVLFPLRKRVESAENIDDDTFLKVKNVLTCPVCLDIYKDPVYIKKCLHRFCRVCIERVIRSQDNKTCPACRIQLGSKRLLRNDTCTNEMIKNVFSNLKEFQLKESLQYENFYKVKTKQYKEQGRYPQRRRATRSSVPDVPTSTASSNLTLESTKPSSPVQIKKEAIEETTQDKTPVKIASRTRKALSQLKPEVQETIKPVIQEKTSKLMEKIEKPSKPPKPEKDLKPEKAKKPEKESPKPKKDLTPPKPVIEIADEPDDCIMIHPKDSNLLGHKKRKTSSAGECILIDEAIDVDDFKKSFPKNSPKIPGFPDYATMGMNPDLLRANPFSNPFMQTMTPYPLMFGGFYPGMGMPGMPGMPGVPGMPSMSPMSNMDMMNSYYQAFMGMPPSISPSMPQSMAPTSKQLEMMIKNAPNTKNVKTKDGSLTTEPINISQTDFKQYNAIFNTLSTIPSSKSLLTISGTEKDEVEKIDRRKYNLNESDFFEFEDSFDGDFEIDSEDAEAMRADEYDEELSDLLKKNFLNPATNASSENSFLPMSSDFVSDVLNTKLQGQVLKLCDFMKSRKKKVEEEIKKFEELMKEFHRWAFRKYRRNYDVRLVDETFDAFLFENSPVYVYIEHKHYDDRLKVLERVREYLFFATEDKCFIKSDVVHNVDFEKKLIFTFIGGKKEFIIQVKQNFTYMVTQFITRVTQIDERIHQLGTFLYFWAEKKKLLYNVIKPNVLYIMMIFFLMDVKPPLVPKLFKENDPNPVEVSFTIKGLITRKGQLKKRKTTNINYEQDPVKINAMTIDHPNKMQLGELIYEFFKNCSEIYIRPGNRLCVRSGEIVGFNEDHRFHGFTVVHPFFDIFDLAPNLSRNRNGALDKLKKEIDTTYEKLRLEQIKSLF